MPDAINIEVLVQAGDDDVQEAAKELKILMAERKNLKEQEEELAKKKKKIEADMALQLAILDEEKVEYDGIGTLSTLHQERMSLKKDKLVQNLVDYGMAAKVVNEIIEKSSTKSVIDTVQFRKAKE